MVSRGNLYIDKHGILRMVMGIYDRSIVRGINVSTMSIDGIMITEELESIFLGMYDPRDKRHKVLWPE